MAIKFKGKPVEEIVQSLRADEWISHYQYHVGKEISQGKAKNFLDKVFDANGDEEYNDHFKGLSDWLQAMGFPLETSFVKMNEIANTPFVDVDDPTSTEELFDIAWQGEQEAVEAYRAAIKEDAVQDYPELVWMFMEYLKDELSHVKELADVGSQIKGGTVDLAAIKPGETASEEGDEKGDDEEEGEDETDKGEEGEDAEDDEKEDTKKSDEEDEDGESDKESDEEEEDEGDDKEEVKEGEDEPERDDKRPNAQFIPLENHLGRKSREDSEGEDREDDDKGKTKKGATQVNENEVILEKKSHKKMGVLEKIMMKGMK